MEELVRWLTRLQRQVDGLIKPEVGNVTQSELLASDYSLINGSFLIWQRGTSFAAAASGTFTADRWGYYKSGVMVHTITQDTSVPTVSEAETLLLYSVKLDVTTIDASIGAADFCMLQYPIEGFNFAHIAQREFTLGFWVRDTKTGIHCVAFRNSIGDRSYVAEYTINAADTWEYKTITVSASPSAGTWNYNTSLGLQISFVLAAGSGLQTTPDTWQTGNYLATSNQVNAVDSTSNNFYLTGVTITPGSVATPPFIPDYQKELHRCMRYYELHGGAADSIWVGGTAGGVETWRAGFGWVVPKRINPTVSIVGTWNTVNISTGPTLLASSVSRYTMYIITTGAGAWQWNTNSVDDYISGNSEY